MTAGEHRGFSLVELLVVLVLGTILVMASYQILASNTRVYALNGARSQGQQTLRGGVDILSGELREISLPGGDLVSMKSNAMTIRVQRALGIVMAVDYNTSPVKLTSFKIGPAFQTGDSVFVFHDNDPTRVKDDRWFSGVVSAVDSTATWSGQSAQILAVPFVGSTASGSPPDSVRQGAPIRAYELFTYGEYELDGETYLGRASEEDEIWTPIVGPLLPRNGVTFRYLDETGHVTAVASRVAQVQVTLRYQSKVNDFQGDPVSDSLVMNVYPRN